MSVSLDEARPTLSPTARLRIRSDGSGGLYDGGVGTGFEVAPDQAALLGKIDGKRTIGSIMEAHYAATRTMPLSALDDLLTKLTEGGVLTGVPPTKAKPQRWIARALSSKILLRFPLPALGPLSLVVSLACVALATLVAEPPPLSALDVLLVLPGAILAQTVRRWTMGTALWALGAPLSHVELGLSGVIPHLGPDEDSIVLLDRSRRVAALLAGLTGVGLGLVIAASWSKGLMFGAAVACMAELCPFAPTLGGRLLATLAGRVDLQDHARAYVERRMIARAVSRSTFEGEIALVWTTMLSLGWLTLAVRLIFTKGAVATLRLLSVGIEEQGAARYVLLGGAGLLALLLPVSLVALGLACARALSSLRPTPPTDKGEAPPAGAAKAELSSFPLFARLPPAEQQAIAEVGEERRFSRGATLVAQGAQGDRFYAVLAGHVSVHVEADSGLSREVARLGPGDCFGEAALLGEGKRTATVRAEDDVTVLSLGTEAFARLKGQLGADQLSGVLRNSAALKRSAFFGQLPAERLSSLAFRLAPRPVTGGEVVVQEGQPGLECFLVSEGKFEVLGGEGKTVATLGPGDHFGEVALLRDIPRTATVRALEPGVVLALSREDFLGAVVRDLGLSRRLEALAAQRVEAVR